MYRGGSTLLSLGVVALAGAGVFLAVDGNLPGDLAGRFGLSDEFMMAGAMDKPPAPPMAASTSWAATAPGKVEPRNGELTITSQAPGRIIDLAVKLNDSVRAGDLMILLDDGEARARLRAAAARADAAKRLRDNDSVGRLATRRRKADDRVHKARRILRRERAAFDAKAAQVRGGSASQEELELARSDVAEAEHDVISARARLRRTRSAAGVPLETQKESALSAARADEALAAIALERRQIRAPVDGTIMEVEARIGETVAPLPGIGLLKMGDLTALRVRVEVEERDVGNVRLGQAVIVRSKAFRGKDMTGRVSSLAPRLGRNRIAAQGPRRPTDLDVLEAMVALDGPVQLLPGMRVDVYFKPVAAAMPLPAAKATN